MSNITLSILFALALGCATALKLPSENLPALEVFDCITDSQQAAKFDHSSYKAIIKNPFGYKCGGSLIGNEWILTAAICLLGYDHVDVYLGANISSKAEVHYEVNKDDFTIYSTSLLNNIALIKIPYTNYSSTMNKTRLPAIAKSYSSYEGEKVIGHESGLKADLKLNVTSNEECKQFYTFTQIRSDVLCIASLEDVTLPCTATIGGPLVLESNNIQIGVASYVAGLNAKCTTELPYIYTRVTSYLHWIKQHTGISY